jgi:GT2 family glycosyltransferase
MKKAEADYERNEDERAESDTGEHSNQAGGYHHAPSGSVFANAANLQQDCGKASSATSVEVKLHSAPFCQALLDVGLVIIGRNEGHRLRECLASLPRAISTIVYVDSGSTDGSQQTARAAGAVVVELDLTIPFTAARARNAGMKHLLELQPDTAFIQFLDGDCLLQPAWLPTAIDFLRERDNVALVFGRRRERHPSRSVYNAICDDDWAGPEGEATECGGDILIRADVLAKVGGYRENLIAGEEPDLCVRLRESGFQIWRLDCEMTLHDANIIYLTQWWRRSLRTGHAYAQVSLAHRHSRFRIWKSNLYRTFFWSGLLPIALILALAVHPVFSAIALAYPLQILRFMHRGSSLRRALLSLLGKFAEMQGVMRYAYNRLVSRQSLLIEYK